MIQLVCEHHGGNPWICTPRSHGGVRRRGRGDARCTARLIPLASALGRTRRILAPDDGPAMLQAASRCFRTSSIETETIVARHAHATCRRMQAASPKLAVQDTGVVGDCHVPATDIVRRDTNVGGVNTGVVDDRHVPATEGLGSLASPTQHGARRIRALALPPACAPVGGWASGSRLVTQTSAGRAITRPARWWSRNASSG